VTKYHRVLLKGEKIKTMGFKNAGQATLQMTRERNLGLAHRRAE
jgi:hypothetical protein